MTEENRQKLEIDWLRTVAGALAAVSSAVLLSTLGAAGTIVGAALGSVIATVGGAVYSAGLAHSRERLAEAQNVALRKVGVAQAEVRRASRRQGDDEAVEAHLAHADARLAEAREDLDVIEPVDPGWRERLAELPWRRIALVAAGLFAASVLAITAFELVAGESVSSITGGTDDGGGTTVSHIGGSDGTTAPDEGGDEEAPSDTASDTASPTDGPSTEGSPTTQPTEEPSESPSASPSAPTPTASPTLSVEPSPSPSAQ
jgi:hypothetical protein